MKEPTRQQVVKYLERLLEAEMSQGDRGAIVRTVRIVGGISILRGER